MLPTAKLSEALRQLKVGRVKGYSSNRAEVLASKTHHGIFVEIDAVEGIFAACLLNQWDDLGERYISSDNFYDDMISSNSWSVMAAWIKDKLS